MDSQTVVTVADVEGSSSVDEMGVLLPDIAVAVAYFQ